MAITDQPGSKTEKDEDQEALKIMPKSYMPNW